MDDKILKLLSVMATIIGIIDGVCNILDNHPIKLRSWIIFGLGLTMLIILIFVNNPLYCVKKFFFYLYNKNNSMYKIEKSTSEYTIKSNNKFGYSNLVKLKIKEKEAQSYVGRIRWTADNYGNTYNNVQLVSNESNTRLYGYYDNGDGGWWRYLIWFPPSKKGEKKEIGIKIDEMSNQQIAPKPYLLKKIENNMEQFVQKVIFEDNTYQPKKFVYEIFAPGNQTPIIKETYNVNEQSENKTPISNMKYDYSKRIVTATVDHPIVGYRYRISWES